MYAGQIMEQASVENLFDQPLHPYTLGLIRSIPILGEVKERLDVIDGVVPNLIGLPAGCRFAPRCRARVEHNLDICLEKKPELLMAQPHHFVRCWLYQDGEDHSAPIVLEKQDHKG